MNNTTDIGRYGEKLAAKALKRKRYRILAKNKHYSHNEIDIIATSKKAFVFVEVKTRTIQDGSEHDAVGIAASAVDKNKQQRLIKAAREYISANPTRDKEIRFDVVEVYLSRIDKKLIKINHIENAFGIK